MTREDEIRSISQKYEMDKEKVRDILERGVRYADADKAALFACMTGKDIEEVLALRREEPWGRVQVRLGITGDRYDEKYFRHRACRLHRFYGVEEDRAFNALKEGYPNHWIRLAYLLEVKTVSLFISLSPATCSNCLRTGVTTVFSNSRADEFSPVTCMVICGMAISGSKDTGSEK